MDDQGFTGMTRTKRESPDFHPLRGTKSTRKEISFSGSRIRRHPRFVQFLNETRFGGR
jgi:hypothetical protein